MEEIKSGRPKGTGGSRLDRHREEIEELIKNCSTKVAIAKKYGYTPCGLYLWMKKNNVALR